MSTPNQSDDLIDTSISELSDRLGVSENRVADAIQQMRDVSAFAGKVSLTNEDLTTLTDYLDSQVAG